MKIGNWKKKNNNTSSLIKNRLLTLKRSFSLANTIQSTTTEPHTPTPSQEDSQPNTIWTGAFVPPFMQEASMRLIGQTQNARRRKRKMRNCLTHTTKCQKGNTIWQPDKWPIIHLLFFYDFFYFILFCCLHNETPCIGWEIQKTKKNKYWYWWSWVCQKECHPNRTPCTPPFPFTSTLPTTPPSIPPSPFLQFNAAQGPDHNHSRMPACHHTLPLHSLGPEPLFISDWPIFVTPSNGVTYSICTKWLVFVYLSKYQGVLLWEKW